MFENQSVGFANNGSISHALERFTARIKSSNISTNDHLHYVFRWANERSIFNNRLMQVKQGMKFRLEKA